MISYIYEVKAYVPHSYKASFSLPPKEALIAYVEQVIFKNANWWEYPKELSGLRESTTLKDHWYWDSPTENLVICAYPKETPLKCIMNVRG